MVWSAARLVRKSRPVEEGGAQIAKGCFEGSWSREQTIDISAPLVAVTVRSQSTLGYFESTASLRQPTALLRRILSGRSGPLKGRP